MDFLHALNWEQLGVSSIFIVFVLWLYVQKDKECKKWQERTFDVLSDSQERITAAVKTIDTVMEFLKNRTP